MTPPPPSNAMMKKVAPVAALIGAAALARMRPTPNKAAVVPPKKKRTDAPQKAPPNCKKRFPWRVVCLSLGAAALSRFFSAANRAARAAARVPVAPKVKRKPHKVVFGTVAGENRGYDPMDPPVEKVDDLFWLRDDKRKNPEVLRYLNAENHYTEQHLKHVEPLTDTLYHEIIGTIKESDTDLPFRWGDYEYFVVTKKGHAYPIILRKKVTSHLGYKTSGHSREEIVLDINDVAKPLKYCGIGSFKPSPMHTVLAYSVDPKGYETYEIKFKDLTTGRDLDDHLLRTTGQVAWGCFNAEEANAVEEEGYREVFYSTYDVAHRPDKVWRHVLGTPQSEDTLVLFEPDALFSVSFRRSNDGKFMLLGTESTETNEISFIGIDNTIRGTLRGTVAYNEHPEVFQFRRTGHRYYPEHRNGRWYILSNRLGKLNFDLYRTRSNTQDALMLMMGKKIERGVGKGEDTWEFVPGRVVQRDGDGQSTDVSSARSSAAVSSADVSEDESGDPLPDPPLTDPVIPPAKPPAPEPFEVKKHGKRMKPPDAQGFPYSKTRTLESLRTFENFLVLEGREEGFSQVWVLELDQDGAVADHHRTEWPTINCCVYLSAASSSLPCVGANQKFGTDNVFITYSSLNCPPTVYQYDMKQKTSEIKKVTPALGFDGGKYATSRMEVVVRDGVMVPISLVWKPGTYNSSDGVKGLASDWIWTGTSPPPNAPLLLTGYGSYGISNNPSFSRDLIPLMDRGITVCIAHVRGGGEMGREWYENSGKYLHKKNTFHDFVDVARDLILNKKFTTPEKLAITGRSAGGLLVGASINLAPDLFRCAVAAVPFVDVMVSMCDSSIPLTTGEWEEWGNPNEHKYYGYMSEYSPMENIPKKNLKPHFGRKPEVLITSGLHDSRVAYWEGAKYAARLRAETSHGSRILLKVDMAAGHFSASDRYKYFKERSYEHAFVLDSLGLSGAKPTWVTKREKRGEEPATLWAKRLGNRLKSIVERGGRD